MSTAVVNTQLTLSGQSNFYQGKVRDVYSVQNNLLVMVATDRISAFDVVLNEGIPGKGQVLNQMANFFLDNTKHLVPNWKISSPHPMVTIGHKAQPFKVEMVIRGYLTGHAWREYSSGKRSLCGISLPEGLLENQAFKEPLITPTTKADFGEHDADISRQAILDQGIVSEKDYLVLEDYTRKLFAHGQAFASSRGLILVDTKYEFGKTSTGQIILIDEIHTPDSSRYFLANNYQQRFNQGLAPKQLSKEFVRQWLISQGFQGKEGQKKPTLPTSFIDEVSERYQELYELITGQKFNLALQLNKKGPLELAIESALKAI
jgi:phosphoribosylaminoimidazole-succinocarboxamide synthase